MSGFNIVFNLDKAVKFTKPFWNKVGQWIVNKIRADAGQGVFQTDDPWKKTYSPDYADLKEHKMSQITGYTKKGKAKRFKKRSSSIPLYSSPFIVTGKSTSMLSRLR